MARSDTYEVKPYHIKPLTGLLDARGTPDQVPIGGYRKVVNWSVFEKGKLKRSSGFVKALSSDPYNNPDIHDQLLTKALAGDQNVRQPVIYLEEVIDAYGNGKLFSGTQNRLYTYDSEFENWQIIWDTLEDGVTAPGGSPVSGCPSMTYWSACVGDIVVFTNTINKPVFHAIEQDPNDDGQKVAVIPDLERLKVSKVGYVTSWNNMAWYMDITQEGRRFSYRILWSDYKRPLSVFPDAVVDETTQVPNSLAGQKDLDSGETIICSAPLGSSLLIYTNRGIWEVVATGNAADPYTFTKKYPAPYRGSRTIAFPRTLVSTGNAHYFLGKDGFYRYDFYSTQPERDDWIHKSTSLITEDINTSNCYMPCASWIADKKAIIISWGTEGSVINDETLTLFMEYPFSSTMGTGFTSFTTHTPSNGITLAQWLIDQCVCTAEEIIEDELMAKAGGRCVYGSATSIWVQNSSTGLYHQIHAWSNPDGDVEPYIDSTGTSTPGVTVEDAYLINSSTGLAHKVLCSDNPDGQAMFYPSFKGVNSTTVTPKMFYIEHVDTERFHQFGCRNNPDGEPEFYLVDTGVSVDFIDEETCESSPNSIFTINPKTDGDVTTEDWEQDSPDSDSLCQQLGGDTIADICSEEDASKSCEFGTVFLAAWSDDGCIKQFSDTDFYREKRIHFNDPCELVQTAYQWTGYQSILLSGPIDLGFPENEKTISLFSVEAYPEVQSVPSQLKLKVGSAANALDPLESRSRCVILWEEQDNLNLDCLSALTEAQSRLENTRPDYDISWPLCMPGRNIYFELSVVNPNGSVVDSGGDVVLSRMSMHVSVNPRKFG